MKLSKIKSICQEAERCVIMELSGGQRMIGNGIAAYDDEGTGIDEGAVSGIFDLDEKKAKDWVIRTIDWVKPTAGEEMVLHSLTVKGTDEWMPLESGEGNIYFIPAKMAEACKGKAEYRKFYLDFISQKQPVIRVMDGMDPNPAAYILPLSAGEAGAVLEGLHHFCFLQSGMDNFTDETGAEEEGQQMSMLEDEDGQ